MTCDRIGDFDTYKESYCNGYANKVIVRRNNPDINLCGFGILANCNCKFSELLNPLKTNQFETTQTATFVSADSLTTIATGAAVSLTINTRIPDTISSVCGNADGFTTCSR